MSMPRHRAKRDASEQEVVSTLTQCGFSVLRLDTPVDLLVGFRGRNYLVEVKSSDKGYGKSLNGNQREFADGWRGGDVIILRSSIEAQDWAVSVASGAAA